MVQIVINIVVVAVAVVVVVGIILVHHPVDGVINKQGLAIVILASPNYIKINEKNPLPNSPIPKPLYCLVLFCK
jgi:hypothetical protein